MAKHKEAREHLLAAIDLMAPDSAVQSAFSALAKEMEADLLADEAINTALVGALFDGLAYGNWPKE